MLLQVQRERFLQALASGCTQAEAARAAQCTSAEVTRLRKTDLPFAAAYADALEDSADALEAEARRRAFGVPRQVLYQGSPVPVYRRDDKGRVELDENGQPWQEQDEHGCLKWVTETVSSDGLLTLLLKGRRKHVFAVERERTGADGTPLTNESDPQGTALAAGLADLLRTLKDRTNQ